MRFKLGQRVESADGTLGKVKVRLMVSKKIGVLWDDGVRNTWDDDDPSIRCAHEVIEYEAALGAPGIGHSFKCLDCDERLWSASAQDPKPVPFKDLDHSEFTLSPADVI